MGAFATLTDTAKKFLNGLLPGSPFIHGRADDNFGDYLDNLHPANWFKSAEQTGTGSSQNVAHGLGRTPSLVFAVVTDNNSGAADIAEGTHDDTNAVFTVTTGAKFIVIAV